MLNKLMELARLAEELRESDIIIGAFACMISKGLEVQMDSEYFLGQFESYSIVERDCVKKPWQLEAYLTDKSKVIALITEEEKQALESEQDARGNDSKCG